MASGTAHEVSLYHGAIAGMKRKFRCRRKWLAIAICAALLAQYAVMAWLAVSRESATYDEPLSVVSAYAASELHDYRLDFEHPPLWKYWAWLGNWGRVFHIDTPSPD